MSLAARIAEGMSRSGPLSIEAYMTLCLHDPAEGYYATRPALGETGDFITAPHVSQMFGEMLGLWAVEVWVRLGRPPSVRLVELGPGDGAMMADVLRAARAAPAFLTACTPWLVETSAPLMECQRRALADAPVQPRWATSLEAVPTDTPVILLANEFLDCLPIRQAVRAPDGWRERRVGLNENGDLAFLVGCPHRLPAPAGESQTGSIFEWSDALARHGRAVGGLIARASGAGLFIDYGRDTAGEGDTLQALRSHRKESPLANPGLADLTAHVDFPTFIAAAREGGALAAPILSQRAFLRGIGIEVRAAALANIRPDRAETIGRQLHRLIDSEEMGALFKVAALYSPGFTPPGFEPAP